ncbi:MAG: DUF418 domain-containing protein [Erythrobacter sp.]
MSARPTTKTERYVVMDALRGFALFGVMLINIWEFGGVDVLITEAQLAALPNAALNDIITPVVRLLVADKANTLFAFLFGLGFWVQMERLEARGASFKAIYLRRVVILLAIGWAHLLFFFAWDVLHIYGIGAFILFACRKLPPRAMLALGLVLMMFAKPLIYWAFEAAGISGPIAASVENDEFILATQAAAQAGDLPGFIYQMQLNTTFGWLLTGGLVGWIAYALGRFFMGAWVARQGWIQNSASNLALFRRWLWPMLLGGLTLEALHLLVEPLEGSAHIEVAAFVLHGVATPMIAAGYICAIVLLFHSHTMSWLVKPFAPVGQMALTNYLLQSVAILTIFIGLGLAGRAGIATFLPMVVAFYALQIIFSSFWMKTFAFGPAEWLWRALTYGEFSKLRRRTEALA